jgi:putative component of membrane protein insertase Oxa1/YidC/SpoIIIJ protein YidD
MIKNCLIALFLLNNLFLVKAQDTLNQALNPEEFIDAFPVKKHRHYAFAQNNENEIQLIFSGLFLFYKAFFSSQDATSCTFSPSCSEYGLQAVKKKGMLLGIPATFDRLSRCNGLNPDKYPIDRKTGLLIDPVP